MCDAWRLSPAVLGLKGQAIIWATHHKLILGEPQKPAGSGWCACHCAVGKHTCQAILSILSWLGDSSKLCMLWEDACNMIVVDGSTKENVQQGVSRSVSKVAPS